MKIEQLLTTCTHEYLNLVDVEVVAIEDRYAKEVVTFICPLCGYKHVSRIYEYSVLD